MKPIKPPITASGDYSIDCFIIEGGTMPDEVKASMRNLLVACELGALVLVQCQFIASGIRTYILCARIDGEHDFMLLPICEMGSIDMGLMSPPPDIHKSTFAKPVYTGDYAMTFVPDEPDPCEHTKDGDDDKVH